MFSLLLSSIRLQTGTRCTCRLCLSPVATMTWLLSLVFFEELITLLGVRSLPSWALLLSILILELFDTFLSDSLIYRSPSLSLSKERVSLLPGFDVLDSRMGCCSTGSSAFGRFVVFVLNIDKSRLISESRGCAAYYGSNPPWINSLSLLTTIACLYLLIELTRCHSALSVSYI